MAILEEKRQNQNQVAHSVCAVFIVPSASPLEAVWMPDNTDIAASGPKSLSSRVKVEPFGAADSSVTRGEPGKSHLSLTCQSQLIAAAYEPSQALRDQIALLTAGQSQGARTPLPVRWEF